MDGDQLHGSTAGTGTNFTVIPWERLAPLEYKKPLSGRTPPPGPAGGAYSAPPNSLAGGEEASFPIPKNPKARRQEMKWGGVFFCKKVEMGCVFFCKKSGPFLNAGCIMYSISIFYFTFYLFGGSAYARNASPCLRACPTPLY